MKKRKLLTVLMASVMVLSIGLTGCKVKDDAKQPDTTKAPETQEPAKTEWKLGDTPLEFEFYVNYDWYAPKGYGTTQQTKWIQEATKVTVKEVGSNGNAEQKFGTMVAGDDLPDVIQMDYGAKWESLINSGKLIALDDFINNPKYPNVKKLVSEQAQILIKRNGKTYGIPNWFGNKDEVFGNNKGWIVNRKIYNELGSPKLETFDDLYAYLKQVKEKYPDIVPLDTSNTNGGVVQVQNMLYVGAAENHWIDWGKSDGTFAIPDFNKKEFTSVFADPALKESYLWTSKFFRDKLLTQDAFTQKREQFQEKLNNGKIAVAGFYDVSSMGDQANSILKDAGYDFVPFFHKEGVNPNNIVVEGRGDIGWNINCITTDAKEPEKIFAFFDWMLSDDGVRTMFYGLKGELWNELDANGAPIPNDKYKSMSDEERAVFKLGDWVPQGGWRVGYIQAAREAQEPDKMTWARKADLFYGKYVINIGNELDGTGNFAPNSEEENIWKNIRQINEQYVSKITFAKSDDQVNSLMAEWEKAVNGAGYDKILQFRNKAWKETLTKLGM